MKIIGLSLFLFCVIPLSATGQNAFMPKAEIFDRLDVSLKGRLRHLMLFDFFEGGGQELLLIERRGSYPEWKNVLSLWALDSSEKKFHSKSETPFPDDVLFFAPIPLRLISTPSFLLIRKSHLEVWSWEGKGFEPQEKRKVVFPFPFASVPDGNVTPLELLIHSRGFFAPSPEGVIFLKIEPNGLLQSKVFSIPPKGFSKSSVNGRPFDLPFMARTSFWYLQLIGGHPKDPGAPVFFAPWMDEVIRFSGVSNASERIFLRQLSEEERDDGRSFVVTFPRDLNGDGITDFLVNKFKGSVTSMQAETRIFFADAKGKFEKEGTLLKPEGNRAAGAFPIDFDIDGRVDLAVASAQYNVWAVIKALLQKSVTVHFSLYRYSERGYGEKADWTRDISFRFNLQEGEIDGLFPTLEGDFNADGFPDALYARNRHELTVLLQKDGSFPGVPNGTYDVSVPQYIKVGNLNEDDQSDVILFDTKTKKNQTLTVLLATPHLL